MSAPEAEMSCRELVEVVTEYLEGTIEEVERGRFEAHLSECEWCDRYVGQTRELIAALGSGEGEPDDVLWQRALEAFRAARSRPPDPGSRPM